MHEERLPGGDEDAKRVRKLFYRMDLMIKKLLLYVGLMHWVDAIPIDPDILIR